MADLLKENFIYLKLEKKNDPGFQDSLTDFIKLYFMNIFLFLPILSLAY